MMKCTLILKKCFVSLAALLMASSLWAQSITVKGTVKDASGPMPGVSVTVEGTTIGTATNGDGSYTLNVPSKNSVLKFNFLGYSDQMITVGNQTVIDVTMTEDATDIEEVVVVGYGTVKKSDLTGAVTQVSEKTIKERPVQNALQAMQGKATGVDITTNSRPGELGEIRIRGNRSINASNDPLYVVDGIPLASGSMADINPNDIASMEILKDASATAIYGSRGANGVVLISTKKGKAGRVSINYDGSISFTKIHSLTDWMNAGELLDWERTARVNAGTYGGSYGTAPDPTRDLSLFMGNQGYMKTVLDKAYQPNPDGTYAMRPATEAEKAMGYADQVPVYDASKLPTTNWTDLATRTAKTQIHQISMSAGSDKSTLYMSVAYLNQQSPMKDQDYQRYTFNMNGEVQATKWLKMGMSMQGMYSLQNYGFIKNSSNTVAKDSYGQALNLLPYAPAFDENGDLLIVDQGPSMHNIVRNMGSATNEMRTYSFMNSSFAEVQLLPWLKYRLNFGAQFRNTREGAFHSNEFTNPTGFQSTSPGVGYNNHQQRLSWTLENLLYADKTWGNHTLGVTLLQSAQKNRTEGINIRAYNIVYRTSKWYDLGNSDRSQLSWGSNYTTNALTSYMGRINYNFKSRYLLTVTGRWDGASVLAKGNKWDFFPSAALAWRIDQENWMKKVDWVNQLKLRVGYGVTGNSAVGAYGTTGSMRSSNYVFNGVEVKGGKSEVMPNKDLGWEKTAQYNVGLDFGVLNNRISGTLEFYQSNTSDLLMPRALPQPTGFTTVTANIGKTRNTGFEVSLTTVNIQKKDFRWTTDWSFSTNKEEIVELVDGKVDMKSNGWFIGQPIAVMRDYKFDRLWQNTPEDQRLMEIYGKIGSKLATAAGQAKIVDQPFIEVPKGTEGSKTVKLDSGEEVTYMDNGFGTINDDDMMILGSNRPKWVGGLTNTFSYKNWQLNFFIYARMGNLYYGRMQTYGRRVEKDVWSETNPGGKYPQPNSTSKVGDYNYTMNFAKGNMVAVRNIALAYNVPQTFLNKLNMSSAQIYVQLNNPWVFGGDLVKTGINPDDVKGWNSVSDAKMGGQSNNTILMRSYVIGLRFGF